MTFRRLLNRVGLTFAFIVIVSPAVLFFLWMISLSLKFEIDNASYPPVFIPDRVNWSNYAAVLSSNRFVTYFFNTLIVTGSATLFAILIAAAGAWTILCVRVFARSGGPRASPVDVLSALPTE